MGLAVGTIAPLGSVAMAAEPPLPPHTVFQSDRYVPRDVTLASAGAHGVLRKEEGTSAYLWTSFADGQSTTLDDAYRPAVGSDIVYARSGSTIDLRDLAGGSSRTVTVPEGHTLIGVYGTTVLTYTVAYAPGVPTRYTLYLHEAASDGTTATRRVEAPDPATVISPAVLAGDARGVVLRLRDTTTDPDTFHLALLDLSTAQLAPGPQVPEKVAVALDETRLVWHEIEQQQIHAVPRSDLLSVPDSVPLPAGQGWVRLGLAGDWVVVSRSTTYPNDPANVAGMPLVAVPLAGGAPLTLLRHAHPTMTQIPGGDLMVTGGADSGHWAMRRVSAAKGDAAAPTLATLTDIAPVPAKIRQLSLAGGTLATEEADGTFWPSFFTRPVTTDGSRLTPGFNTAAGWSQSPYTKGPWSAGDGRVLWTSMNEADSTAIRSLLKDDPTVLFNVPTMKSQLTEVTGRYAVVNGTNTGQQYIGDLDARGTQLPIRTQAITPTTVWGTLAWSQSSTAGLLKVDNLATGTRGTLNTGAPCVATELQAVGRWLYWACGASGPAGVYDGTAKKSEFVYRLLVDESFEGFAGFGASGQAPYFTSYR
ncbi:hypothetical protein ACFPM3_18095 [Streptomyces coeruleoprunus]|uniref:Uncharacterized protein n=1 Tax=Streptomyces coeruleoprunus TaxID=285563 RepID=A0ABV9XF42_9ACTN